MARSIDEILGRSVGVWVGIVVGRPGLVAIGVIVATLAVAPWVAGSLALNSDEESLFAGDAAYTAARDDFRRAFPALADAIVVVLDDAPAARLDEVASELAEKLRREPEVFPAVTRPDGGTFFDRQGLLYLDGEDLEEVLDHFVGAQPYFGTLAVDPSLRGLFELLADAADEAAGGGMERLGLEAAFDAVRGALEAQARGEARPLDWREVLEAPGAGGDAARRVLLVQPTLDFGSLEPAAATLSRLRKLIGELGSVGGADVRVRLTGVYALSEEEAELVSGQASAAGLGAFVLVMLVLAVGLRSLRVVAALVATLLVGLLWTAVFAAVSVGHLNLISVAFGVLFIGLSVDFGIHLCVRVGDRAAAAPIDEAVVAAARDVGGSLVICAVTTAVGFYAFLGTDFLGVAELGLIAGNGMIIGLASNLTLLPALLVLWPPHRSSAKPRTEGRFARGLERLPFSHPGAVVGATVLAAAGAVFLVPRAHFDWNPLHVRDPAAPSVQAFEALLADGQAQPWNLNVLAAGRDEARLLAAHFEALPSVAEVVTLDDFVPDDQEAKQALIEEVAFLLHPSLAPRIRRPAPSVSDQRRTIAALLGATRGLAQTAAEPLAGAAQDLAEALTSLDQRLDLDPAPSAVLEQLDRQLAGSLPSELERLRTLLAPEVVRVEELPEGIRSQWIAADGRVRVELRPSEDLGEMAALEQYVSDVRALAPGTYGEALVIYEIGRTVVHAFRQALGLAALLIFVLIAVLWRDPWDTALAVVPIGLAALFTVAGTVVLAMPFNFANVIVLPLLMGMGVDSGIHLIHRVRSAPLPGGGLLRTSTSRAVLLSALTTLASFGVLGISTHLGMRSLGHLLTLGIAVILVCNLVVLTALVRLTGTRRSSRAAHADRG